MYASVVDQIDLYDVMAVGLQYARNGVSQQVVAYMAQMQGLVGIGRRIFDHYRAACRRSLTEALRRDDAVETLRPERGSERQIQKALDDVVCSDLGIVGHHLLAYLSSRSLGRLAADAQKRKDDQRIVALELLAGLLYLQLYVLTSAVQLLDGTRHGTRDETLDIDHHSNVLFQVANLRFIRQITATGKQKAQKKSRRTRSRRYIPPWSRYRRIRSTYPL